MVDKLERGENDGAPRWVKIFGIVVAILVLVFVILSLTGLAPSHVPGGQTPPWQH